MKKSKPVQNFLLALLLIGLACLNGGRSYAEIPALSVRVYDNGAIVILDQDRIVTAIEGHFCLPDYKDSTFFKAARSKSQNQLEGIAELQNGTKVVLRGSVTKTEQGLRVNYNFVPSSSIKIQVFDAYIRLIHDDWTNASYQMGLDTYKVTPELSKKYWKSFQQSVIVLGPSLAYKRLYLEILGDDELGVSVSDYRPQQPVMAFHVESDKSLNKSHFLEAGESIKLGFTLAFNRPLLVLPGIRPSAEYDRLKTQMMEMSLVLPKPANTPPPSAPVVDYRKDPPYKVPADAKTTDFWVSQIAGYHLFIPVELEVQGKEYKGSFLWDTGVTTKDGDFVITEEFSKSLDLKISKKHHGEYGALDSKGGSMKRTKMDFVVLNDRPESDAGPISISVKSGEMRFEDASLYTHSLFDFVPEHAYDPKAPFFNKNKVIGIVPFYLMKNYLISMDYKNQKIYFRPLNSKQRVFFNEPPLSEWNCLVTDSGIYCPYSINQKPMGYAHLDTGSPRNLVDPSVLGVSDLPVTSYVVGGYDILQKESTYMPLFFKGVRDWDQKGEMKLDKTSNIGNDFFKDQFITIDPLKEKIYIEKIP